MVLNAGYQDPPLLKLPSVWWLIQKKAVFPFYEHTFERGTKCLTSLVRGLHPVAFLG